MEIRRLRADEGAQVREIRLRALRDTPSAFASSADDEGALPQSEWDISTERRATSDFEATFVAVDDGEWIGLVGGFVSDDRLRTVDLVAMWTAPNARRRGVGRDLVRAVLAWASSIEAGAVELWVMRGNDPALRLYQTMGFDVADDYQPSPSDPCQDEIRMRRRIPTAGDDAIMRG